ncbi:MAG: MoaD/ThiS family protein [Pirellulales bacterium]
MHVDIELYGVARQRAGTSHIQVPASGESLTLAQIITRLAESYPGLARECFPDGNLARDYAVCVNGERFVRAADTLIRAGESILIMSADAGG